MKMKFNLNGTMKNLGIMSEDQSGNLDLNLELEFAPEEFKDVLRYQLEVLPQIYNMIKDIQNVNEHEQEQANRIFELEREIENLKRKEERKTEKKKESVPSPYYGNGRPRP
nr:MAG TPA: hypothetical protein [Caudoviricetes sp.]